MHEYSTHSLCLVGAREGACTSAQMDQPQQCDIWQGIALPAFKYLLLKVRNCTIGHFCGDGILRSALRADHASCTSAPCDLYSKMNDGSVYCKPRVCVERCGEKLSNGGITSYKKYDLVVQWTAAVDCECTMKERASRVWFGEKGRLHMQAIFALTMMNPTLVHGHAGASGPDLVSTVMDSAIVITMAITIAVMATNAIGLGVAKRKDKLQRFGRYTVAILSCVGLIAFVFLPIFI